MRSALNEAMDEIKSIQNDGGKFSTLSLNRSYQKAYHTASKNRISPKLQAEIRRSLEAKKDSNISAFGT